MSAWSETQGRVPAWSYQVNGLTLSSTRPIPGLWPADSGAMSDLDVWFGPDGGGDVDLSRLPRQRVYTSPDQDDEGNPILEIWELDGNAYTLLAYRYGIRFVLDQSTSRLWVTWPASSALTDASALLLQGLVMSLILRRRGVVFMHGVAIAAHGYATVLFGPGGLGKSTLAAALIARGCAFLADDVVALAEVEDGYWVQPGCPRLHLWPDAVHLLDTPLALSALMPGWDKVYLDLSGAGAGFQPHPLPLGAIYLIERPATDTEAPRFEPVRASEGLAHLLSGTYVPYLMQPSMRIREFAVLSDLVDKVPVKRLRWGTGSAALAAACQGLLSDLSDSRPTST